jgi:predicted RNA-binding protein YlxR (DUF448 family)
VPRREPERTCAGCRTAKPKHDLLRFVRTADGTVSVDASGKSAGRGVYVCRNTGCLHTAVNRRALDRGLKTSVPDNVLESARAVIAALAA